MNITYSDSTQNRINSVDYQNKVTNVTFNPIPSFLNGGLPDTETDVNINYNIITGGDFVNNYQASINFENNEEQSLGTWTTSDSEVATVNQNGYVSNINSGNAKILLNTRYGNYGKNIKFEVEYKPKIRFFNGFVNGCASHNIANNTFSIMQNSLDLPENIDPPGVTTTIPPGSLGEGIGVSNLTNNFSWGSIQESEVVSIYDLNPPNKDPNKVYIFKGRFLPPFEQRDFLINWNPRDNNWYLVQNVSRFLIQNDRDSYYKNNPFMWLNKSLSGITVQTSTSDSITKRTHTGTLVTKRHMVHVRHAGYTPSIGTVVKFVDDNNNIFERTIINRYESNRDFGVTLLDEDVPESISVYKVLPENFRNYFPLTVKPNSWYALDNSGNRQSIQGGRFPGLLALRIDQDKSVYPVLVENFNDFSINQGGPTVKTTGMKPLIYNSHVKLDDSTRLGDSGSPRFLIINDELVVYGVAQSYSLDTFFSYDFVNQCISQINSPGYEAQAIDMSNFISYAEQQSINISSFFN